MDKEEEHFRSLFEEFVDKVSGGRAPLSWAAKGSDHACLHPLGSTGGQEGKAAYSGSLVYICHLSLHPDRSQQAFAVFLGERENNYCPGATFLPALTDLRKWKSPVSGSCQKPFGL